MGKAPDDDRRIGLDEEKLHTTTRSMLDDRGPGHTGRSAQELSGLSQRWAATGQRHTQRIDTLGRRIGDAGIS